VWSGIAIWALFFGVWMMASRLGWVNALLVPPPEQVFHAIFTLFAEQDFASDVLISVMRVLVAFALACVVAVPLGLAMGAFPAIDAVLSPSVSAWRYLPAPS
jgi:NitT/TauT family transport system permease protein